MKKDRVVKKHERLWIPKGTEYLSCHPRKNGKQIAKRSYKTGPVNTETSRYSDAVCWSGIGGYWNYAAKEDVGIWDGEQVQELDPVGA